MNIRRPKTVMMRIKKSDLAKLKILAKNVRKKLPDFQSELIKLYKIKNEE